MYEDIIFTELCSVSEAGSYLKLRLLLHSTLGLIVMKTKLTSMNYYNMP